LIELGFDILLARTRDWADVMTTEHSADQSADILRVVNAAASPTDLGEALAGSADLSAGVMAARRLIEW
jgi:hypothetical protein